MRALNSTKERRIALFLDFENLVTNTGISPANFDLQPALDRLLEKGKVVFRRAYCDWSRFREAKAPLHEHGVELVDVPPSTRAGKNAADMRLVIDALELCYRREHIDTYVIASGDSDFCPLAYKLRENDRLVIGLAIKEATSPLFVNACDEFIYLRPTGRAEGRGSKSLGKATEVGAGEGRTTGRGTRHRGGSAAEKEAKASAASDATTKVPAFVTEVVKRLLATATQPLNPSFIKETIVRKKPDFDERDLGFSTFSKMLASMEKEGLLKRQQHGRQWYVVPADGTLESKPAAKAGAGVGEAAGQDEDEEEIIPDPED